MAAHNRPPCPACGVWKCRDCGSRTNRRNRYFPGRHHCPKCGSFNGRMLPTHHRPNIYQDHVEELDPQATCHYPIEDAQPKKDPDHA